MGLKLTKVMRLGNLVVVAAMASFGARAGLADSINLSTGQAAQGSNDPNYKLTTTAETLTSGAPFVTVLTPAGNFPDPFWTPDTATSSWISPKANYSPNGSDADGSYTYSNAFVLSASSNFTGLIYTDNSLASITLNGFTLFDAGTGTNNISLSPTGPGFATGTGATFTIPKADFANGANLLSFTVVNGVQSTGNPTGLDVALTGSGTGFTFGGVPLPLPASASIGMVLMGGFGLVQKRNWFGKLAMKP